MTELKSNDNKRNIGIDLLRVASMIFIVLLHVLGQGGVLTNAVRFSVNYDVAWFMESLAYPSVAIFGIIMGYVGLSREHKVSGFIYVWLQVICYTVVITGLFYIFMPEAVSGVMLKYMFSPIMSEQYWYISAYLGLYLFMDGINFVVNNMPRFKVKIMIIASLLLFSILPVISDTDVFAIRYGCSIISVACFYFYGAYIKKYDCFNEYTNVNLTLLFMLGVIINWGSKICIEAFVIRSNDNTELSNILFGYNTPTVILSAVMAVVLFSRISINGFWTKIISAVCPMTLGVYLANTHPLIFANLMKDRFVYYADAAIWKLVVGASLSAVAIYLIGISIDGVRFIIFELLHIKARLMAVENYITNKIDK